MFRSIQISIYIAVFAALGFSSRAEAASPRIFIKAQISKVQSGENAAKAGLISRVPVKLKRSVLDNNRRFRLITSSGRSMFGRKLRAVAKRSSFSTAAGSVTALTYSGQIRRPGEGNSGNFHFTVLIDKNGSKSVSGSFNSAPYSQNVHQVPGGTLSMDSYKTAQMPACGGEMQPDLHAHDLVGAAALGAPATGQDGELIIDIAILLTPEMVTAYGSLNAAIAEANNAIASANTAYVNSEIAQELRLVYVGASATTQGADMGDDLARLATPNDGAFDEAQTIREAYGADMVSLLWHEDVPSSCGIAYIMQAAYIGPVFADYAYSVVMDACATGNYSFAHELGHNMGAAHNIADAGGQAAYNYSYGYHFTGTNAQHYRTVMAYASGLSGETRVPYFSNPDVQFQGAATGTVNANNALTLNNTAPVVAAFRDAIDGTPVPTPTPTATPEATATPVPPVTVFKNVKTSLVKNNKCKIAGAVKYEDGTAAPSITTQLQRTSGLLLKVAVTSDSGKFSFKTTRNKKYRLVTDSLTRTVRCK